MFLVGLNKKEVKDVSMSIADIDSNEVRAIMCSWVKGDMVTDENVKLMRGYLKYEPGVTKRS